MKIQDIYEKAIQMGPKENCFAFGGFAHPESSRGGTMQTPGLLYKTAEGKSFSKAGTLLKRTFV